jgi:hypothetical protein
MLVSDPIIDFIAKGFFAMRGAVVTSTGTVGAIASFLSFAWWFMVFADLLPVLYMTFGLPQILPDHVLRWIGAGVSDLGETQAVGQMRSGMAHAASSGALPSGEEVRRDVLRPRWRRVAPRQWQWRYAAHWQWRRRSR